MRIIRGRNHDYPDTVEGRVSHLEDRQRRITWGLVTLLLLLQLASAAVTWIRQEDARDACKADADRVEAIATTLKAGAVANTQDGNVQTAALLNALVVRLEELPEPNC